MHVLTLLSLLKWRRPRGPHPARVAFAVGFLAFVLNAIVVPREARAEEPGVASFVGRQPSGLPGVGRVGFASDNPRTLVASGTGGLAITEPQANEVGDHYRYFGGLAAAVQPLRFLSAALMFDGRLESHGTAQSTALGEPRAVVRAAQGVTRSLAVGAQVDLLVPGAEFPSFRPDASRLDARALATIAPPGMEFALAFNVGYRRDGTSNILSGEERARIRTGDKLALGISDFDAVLLGVGASKRLGSGSEVIGEFGWDVLLGSNAPSAVASPLRIGGGARHHLVNGSVQLEALIVVGVGERPAVTLFAPIEPRIAFNFGVRWILPFDKPPPDTTTKPPVDTTVKPSEIAAGTVQGRVKSEGGEPIANARVTAGDERAGDTAADGSFKIDNVKTGRVRVTAKAAGFDDIAIDVDVDANKSASAELVMKKTIKPGQLRGLVRSFNGKPLVATVRVEPIGTEVKTDADGTFTIDVPPGAYEVSVSAPGHSPQKRPVQVEENGVTVLNADLRQGGATP